MERLNDGITLRSTGIGMQELSFKTIEKSFVFKGNTVKIKRIKNLDELVDQIDEALFKEDERLPYWAELWPSAIGFSRFISEHGAMIKNKTVLELGCGLGLTAIVLAIQKPSFLLVTDYEQDALHITADNFKLNNLALPKLQEADWRTADLGQSFDVICASDVLYERRFFAPLLRMFKMHLKEDGKILLAEPGRPIAVPFFELLAKENFSFKSSIEWVEQDHRDIRVSIYQIQKN